MALPLLHMFPHSAFSSAQRSGWAPPATLRSEQSMRGPWHTEPLPIPMHLMRLWLELPICLCNRREASWQQRRSNGRRWPFCLNFGNVRLAVFNLLLFLTAVALCLIWWFSFCWSSEIPALQRYIYEVFGFTIKRPMVFFVFPPILLVYILSLFIAQQLLLRRGAKARISGLHLALLFLTFVGALGALLTAAVTSPGLLRGVYIWLQFYGPLIHLVSAPFATIALIWLIYSNTKSLKDNGPTDDIELNTAYPFLDNAAPSGDSPVSSRDRKQSFTDMRLREGIPSPLLLNISDGSQMEMAWEMPPRRAFRSCCKIMSSLFALVLAVSAWVVLLLSPFWGVGAFGSPCIFRDPQDNHVFAAAPVNGQDKEGLLSGGGDAVSPHLDAGETRRLSAADGLPPKPLLLGYRGSPLISPENTSDSFREALCEGASGVRADIRVSACHTPFLYRDGTFDKFTDAEKMFPGAAVSPVELFTWADIEKLHPGSWWIEKNIYGTIDTLDGEAKTRISMEKIPQLEEIVAMTVREKSIFYPDIICPPCNLNAFDCGDQCFMLVIETVKRAGAGHLLWWGGGLRDVVRKNLAGAQFVVDANMTFDGDKDVDIISTPWTDMNAQRVQVLHNKGYAVHTASVNTAWQLSYFWCAGVDSVSSDRVGRLASVDQPIYFLSWKEYEGVIFGVDIILTSCVVLFLAWLTLHK